MFCLYFINISPLWYYYMCLGMNFPGSILELFTYKILHPVQVRLYSTSSITLIYVATLKPVTLSLLVIDCNILLSFRLNSSLLK